MQLQVQATSLRYLWLVITRFDFQKGAPLSTAEHDQDLVKRADAVAIVRRSLQLYKMAPSAPVGAVMHFEAALLAIIHRLGTTSTGPDDLHDSKVDL